MKKILLSMLVSVALVGMAGQSFASTNAAKAIASAKAAQKAAASVDGEWRDVGKFLKQAEAALKKGDKTTAIKLAAKAKTQAELGYQQALAQRNAKFPPAYVH